MQRLMTDDESCFFVAYLALGTLVIVIVDIGHLTNLSQAHKACLQTRPPLQAIIKVWILRLKTKICS